MSNQQLPVIKNLREGLEVTQNSIKREAIQTGKKLRKSAGQQSITQAPRKQEESTEAQEDKQQPKLLIDQTKLFSKKSSIFSTKSQNQNISNIFANRKSVNLFNLKPQSSNQQILNIFTLATKSQPIVKNELEDDLLSQSSQGPQDNGNEQNLKQPQEKVMKFTYQDKMQKVGEFRVIKFKNGVDVTKEGVMLLSLEKQKETESNIIYLILRNQATKITIYQSILLPNTKLEHFLNKDQNIKFWAVRSKKKEESFVPEKQIVKVQFQNVDQAKKFKQTIEEKSQSKVE